MNNLSKYLPHLRWRGMSIIKKIWTSMTKNYLSMLFVFQLRMDFQHPCSMKFKIKIRNIPTFPTKNGVTSCPSWRRNITKTELRIKSKDLRPIRQHRPILIEIRAQKFHVRKRQELVYYRPARNMVIKNPSNKVHSITTCCARIMKWLSAYINTIS